MDSSLIIYPSNGLQYDWQAIAANPSGQHLPQSDLVAYKANYVNQIAQARARGLEPILVSLPIIDPDRYFAYVTRGMTMQQRFNVFYWLGGSTSRLNRLHEQYNLLLFRLAAAQCVHLVDVTSPMLADAHCEALLEQDGISLSAAGLALVNAELNKVRAHETA